MNIAGKLFKASLFSGESNFRKRCSSDSLDTKFTFTLPYILRKLSHTSSHSYAVLLEYRWSDIVSNSFMSWLDPVWSYCGLRFLVVDPNALPVFGGNCPHRANLLSDCYFNHFVKQSELKINIVPYIDIDIISNDSLVEFLFELYDAVSS